MKRCELDEQARLLADRLERGGMPRGFLSVFPARTQKAIIVRALAILRDRQADIG